jgi:hypothetical protein
VGWPSTCQKESPGKGPLQSMPPRPQLCFTSYLLICMWAGHGLSSVLHCTTASSALCAAWVWCYVDAVICCAGFPPDVGAALHDACVLFCCSWLRSRWCRKPLPAAPAPCRSCKQSCRACGSRPLTMAAALPTRPLSKHRSCQHRCKHRQQLCRRSLQLS